MLLGLGAAWGSPSEREAIVSSEPVFERAPFASAHASTIVETREGLLAAWFGGSGEGRPDASIWTARFEGGRWQSPVQVADGRQATGERYPCWNPVLFQPSSGPLLLFYRVGPSPRGWWTLLRTSSDQGRSWSQAVRLPQGYLGPIRAKPVELPDGTLLAGSSTEDAGWVVHMERARPGDLGAAGAWSKTGGRSWSAMTATSLPNPSAGIDAVRLADGRFLLAYNPTASRRSPLALAVSRDGRSWQRAVTLEDDDGEYSYPALIQGRDGRVHVTYTWRRQRIHHVVMEPKRIE
jgi:predicted neuraminidase